VSSRGGRPGSLVGAPVGRNSCRDERERRSLRDDRRRRRDERDRLRLVGSVEALESGIRREEEWDGPFEATPRDERTLAWTEAASDRARDRDERADGECGEDGQRDAQPERPPVDERRERAPRRPKRRGSASAEAASGTAWSRPSCAAHASERSRPAT